IAPGAEQEAGLFHAEAPPVLRSCSFLFFVLAFLFFPVFDSRDSVGVSMPGPVFSCISLARKNFFAAAHFGETKPTEDVSPIVARAGRAMWVRHGSVSGFRIGFVLRESENG